MSAISDDDYSSSSYYSLSNNMCDQCNKYKINRQTKAYQQQQQINVNMNNKGNKTTVSRLKHIFRCIIIPYHCRRRKRTTMQELCTCVHNEAESKSSDSFTIFDEYSPQQPWIVPSEYHKNILSNSPDSRNQWIFRTGWTPQPDPLELIHSGWCNSCGSCVKKDLLQCSSCGIEPLVTTRHALNETKEKK